MRYESATFSAGQGLVGFYRAPDDLDLQKPVILFWNTGLWNRSGPQRLNTELCILLEEWGLASFRFDLSAMGDSGHRKESMGQQRTMQDLGEVCDYLQTKYGHHRFILFGICSSALDAHYYARQDPRVVGMIMIDTYAYRTRRFQLHYYMQRIFSLRRLKNFVKKHAGRQKVVEVATTGDLYEGVYPEQAEAALDLRSFIGRGMFIWVGFTGAFRHQYSYKGQFRDCFPEVADEKQLDVEFYRDADHLFCVLSQRRLLFSDLKSWLKTSGFLHEKAANTHQNVLMRALENKTPPDAIALELPAARLHNQYGPSETHVATAFSLGEKSADWPDLPSIGQAISGSTAFILDEQGKILTDGQPGELYLAGTCVGGGYWDDARKTAERFVSLTISGQQWRCYKTGDLASWQPDGNLQFLGRSDDQVSHQPVEELPRVQGQGLSRTDKGGLVSLEETTEEPVPGKQIFGAMVRISSDRMAIGERQKSALGAFTQSYNQKTKSSKLYAETHRPHMADPRVVTGFKPHFKELIYPLVTNRSAGPYLWDLDGNQYIDLLNGFGSNFFGYSPDFIKAALHKQIDSGYEIGPQCHLVGEASKIAASLTGSDRVAWCNTGSEAVLGCIRIARTVTGKKKIVSFLGSYHGINDEVIVRSNAKHRSFPAAPGIMASAVENMLVLDYGTEESLQIIQKESGQLAAVLVEPVQSRFPEFFPLEFLRKLRRITEEAGVALILDEVITGFRYHPGGVKQAFDLGADLVSYGKVVGGGLPIGMIAGKKRFMDALDGGAWQFGNSSVPEVGVTYFAGTFVRHPLAMAAAYASLVQIEKSRGALQSETNERADYLCTELNELFKRDQAPFKYSNFGSMMKLKTTDEKNPFAELLPCWLRSKGIHIWDGFPTFLSTSHTDEHVKKILNIFKESLDEMRADGFWDEGDHSREAAVLPHSSTSSMDGVASLQPPTPGARLAKTKDGKPAWFVEDPGRPGRFLMVDFAL